MNNINNGSNSSKTITIIKRTTAKIVSLIKAITMYPVMKQVAKNKNNSYGDQPQ